MKESDKGPFDKLTALSKVEGRVTSDKFMS
jgi:hypothetical protein